MTTESGSNSLKCVFPNCVWETGESATNRSARMKLSRHQKDWMHYTALAEVEQPQMELPVVAFEIGERVSHKKQGPGTVQGAPSSSGRIPVRFDRGSSNRSLSINPNDLVTAINEELANQDDATDESLSDEAQTSPRDAKESLVDQHSPPSDQEEASDFDTDPDVPDVPDQHSDTNDDNADASLTPDTVATPPEAGTTETIDDVTEGSDTYMNGQSESETVTTTTTGREQPDHALSRNLLMPNWAILCVGVGECGTKIISWMNKKPQQLPSRNPVFYPVHCSHFDTQEGSREWVQDKKPPIPSYMVQTAEEESDTTGGLAGATAGMGVLGVGGKPHAAYLAFKRIFDHDKLVELDQSEDQSELKGYDTDYFATPLWSGPGENKVGPYDLIRLSGDREFGSNNIANCGLITFNSARGGTGSGGVSWIHNFINRRSRGRGRRLNLGLSLNVSVLPSLADKNSKLAFPSYAVASFYRLAKSDIHGVILVSNQPMLERNSYDFDKVNIEIREMLVPLIVSPTGKYTVASASSTTDQADLSNAISTTVKDSETGITDTIPGLCIIGFAETYMTGNTGPDDILIQIANLALEQTTCEWTPRSGTKATGYRAFLSGPPGFFESQPTKITSDLITELTKKIQERSEEAGVSSVSAVNGDVSVQAFAQAKSVRLSVLLYNVNVPEFDQLVADGLNLNNENDFDGWDKILRLSEEQVEQLENDQDTATGPPGDDDDGDEPEIVFKI